MNKIEEKILKLDTETLEWLWKICSGFILLIIGVNFMPNLENYKLVLYAFMFCILTLAILIVLFTLRYQMKKIEKIELKYKKLRKKNGK
jgi:lipopolysaccharide export LptBFGC system permease protein LptF